MPQNRSGEVIWSGNITLLRQSAISVGSSGFLDATGIITGVGGVTKYGVGPLIFSGASANTYAGATTLTSGRLQLNKAGVNIAVPGRLIIGDDVGSGNTVVAECLSVNEIGALSAVTVNRSGQVFATVDGEQQELGQLTLATFVNEAGLEPLGENLFRETEASGPATVGVPDEAGVGYIQQNYLEASNVDPVKEITDLISAQRAYEMNSKIIQAADEMAAVVSKNLR